VTIVDGVSGSGVVVTGGGAGIGRALARRLAAAGARVVINDLDADAAAAVAEQAGGYAVPGDAASEQGVRDLIAAARGYLGEIDIYCSNAGIAAGTDQDTPDSTWQRAWEVNVLAHVRVSRELLPAWLERGRGCFVVTASAAGLLTMLGSAPYSVTKHAAEAYAEWLAATYGHRGLVVHCICPQGVKTNMLAESGRAGQVVLKDAAIEPEQVADALLDGMTAGRFLILPHPEVRGYYELRASDTDKWLRGMNRMQQRIEEVEHTQQISTGQTSTGQTSTGQAPAGGKR
jgi:NAD(P)-dependent dehydrogenase (short-subunit alcohol dehydrogenase family)